MIGPGPRPHGQSQDLNGMKIDGACFGAVGQAVPPSELGGVTVEMREVKGVGFMFEIWDDNHLIPPMESTTVIY